VPIEALFQNVGDGAAIADFARRFPGVTAEQVRLVLEHAGRSLQVE
jgi:uncharacterized protein (DUF433 family)